MSEKKAIEIAVDINQKIDKKTGVKSFYQSFITITLYMLIVITPIVLENLPIYYKYYYYYNTTFNKMLIHIILLIVMTLVYDTKYLEEIFVNSFSANSSKFKILITTGYILCVLVPWFLVNLIYIGVLMSRLDYSYSIVKMGASGIVLIFLIGLTNMKQFILKK